MEFSRFSSHCSCLIHPIISPLKQHIQNIFGESSSWSIPHLMIPSRIICVSVTSEKLSFQFPLFPHIMEMPLFPGDLVGFIHFSPFFSSSPSPSCCSVQGDQRVLDRLEQRQLHIQQGTPQKKRIHQTSAYDGYKMVIWCWYHIWCLYDVLIVFNMFINTLWVNMWMYVQWYHSMYPFINELPSESPLPCSITRR